MGTVSMRAVLVVLIVYCGYQPGRMPFAARFR
jgi:hypothetical protein